MVLEGTVGGKEQMTTRPQNSIALLEIGLWIVDMFEDLGRDHTIIVGQAGR
jgi:hypothetical protein